MITNKEVANFFWHGPPPSLYEINSLLSFSKNNFEVNLWSFNAFSLPSEINIRDAREFFKEDDILKFYQDNKQGCLAAFSDAFRYNVLSKYSGWWFDTDCFCLKDQTEFCKLLNGKHIIAGYEDSKHINGAVLNFVDESLSGQALELLNNILINNDYKIKWGAIGPKLITEIVCKNTLENEILPISAFYPVSYKHALDSVTPSCATDVEELCKTSYVYHSWNEVLKRNQVDKNKMPPVGSFLYKQFNNL